ncbi:MAG: TVP38/TMEM64 family protein [Pseudomonadales bacterium]|jgi:uncharacterized membrane protein YdjX (TVP38/TMEM64 family)|nr:TVP38/TMEM64 family protein [Pseudomonadales bacterium]MDP6472705.1 TVP38/TMEM64 family protein [Pseudomonadales bacterium]MDP6827916.1 TVP38/TMEM64 family protein [Pseudomonadales bacterium]MDP6973500.1 TVP38/TMEM64 family protein [Pseudomonadales bacterium]|tara:strand:+ start:105 stop:791 length:687 start_codon:yes stop_codon:yes gene_type:complete
MKPAIFLIAAGTLVLVAWLLPLVEWISSFLTWVDTHRAISWLVFIVAYVMLVVLLMPGSILTMAAGFLFGLPFGFAVISFASTLGASLAFLTGRYLLRDWVERRLAGLPRFAVLDRAVGERGVLIVLLTRLSPLFPFNLLNYALSLTRVRFFVFVLVSWIGMMPGTMLYVYLGSVAQDLTSLLGGELPQSEATTWLFYAGLVATAVLTVLIMRIATKALTTQLEAEAV